MQIDPQLWICDPKNSPLIVLCTGLNPTAGSLLKYTARCESLGHGILLFPFNAFCYRCLLYEYCIIGTVIKQLEFSNITFSIKNNNLCMSVMRVTLHKRPRLKKKNKVSMTVKVSRRTGSVSPRCSVKLTRSFHFETVDFFVCEWRERHFLLETIYFKIPKALHRTVYPYI